MKIQNEINLQPYNTFQVHCIAKYFVDIQSIKEFQTLISNDTFKNTDKKLYLGGGANMLFTKEHFDGLVIKNGILGKEIIDETSKTVTIRVGGGENWDEFILWTIEQGYCGIENLVSIPGSVGAAPIQNIGAYGIEVNSLIHAVEYIDLTTGELVTLSNTECQFSYRDSIFKGALKDKAFVTHVIFTLNKYDKDSYTPQLNYGSIQGNFKEDDEVTPYAVAKHIATVRSSRLPDWNVLGTAGSFFKNPVIDNDTAHKILTTHPELKSFPVGNSKTKFLAGQLIELAGCKGMTRGNVGVYSNHALILINLGGGTGKEIVDLANYIVETVETKYGITLEPEVNYIE